MSSTSQAKEREVVDVIVVGGGSAGCVVASRLSEDPGRSVLLLEAGPDYRTLDAVPEDILRSDFAPQTHDWGYAAEPDGFGTRVAVPRGKVIGGSSSTNYCFAMRARPSDHDAWVALGNQGWGYEDVLPYYRAMESYPHGEDRYHGRNGPLRMSRYDREQLTEGARASIAAGESLGYPFVEDVNAPAGPGFSLAPLTSVGGVRQSTAMTYLAAARERTNLTVRGEALVDCVLFDGARATGVRLSSGEEIAAKHVVLSAGTYNTASVLLRSGVGDASELAVLGIDVVADRSGVGRNLIEHPVMWAIFAAKPPQGDVGDMFQISLSVRSSGEEPDCDLQINPTGSVPTTALPASFVAPTEQHPTNWDVVMFVACVQPKSRGSVRLRSRDASEPPAIDLGLYSDRQDAEKVAEAVRIARRLTQTSPLRDLIVGERTPGADVPDDELLEAVLRSPSHYNHACGTAKMGRADDPTAVVDVNCSVHGLEGLSVIDASIFPAIPRVPTNPMVIAVAEKATAMLKERL